MVVSNDELVAIRGPPEALEPPPDDDWGEPQDDPPFSLTLFTKTRSNCRSWHKVSR